MDQLYAVSGGYSTNFVYHTQLSNKTLANAIVRDELVTNRARYLLKALSNRKQPQISLQHIGA